MRATESVPSQTGAEGLESDPRWQLAQRIARSPSLSRAAQLRAILLYLVKQTISHPGEQIREFDVAHGALGRRKDFNPLDDSIVRVQVAHLRKRLERYFSNEGSKEETVLTIALGSYEPVFGQRQQPEPSPEQSEAATRNFEIPVPEPATGMHVARVPKWLRIGKLWLAAGWALTVIGAVWVALHWSTPNGNPARQSDISNPILHLVFAPGADVNIVVADTTLVSLQNTIHSDISLSEYLDSRFPDNVLAKTPNPVLRETLRALTESRYTSLDDADVVGQCFALSQILGARTYVRYARYLHVRDFERGNFVIVGSRRGNPWVSLFEPSLNFHFEEDPATHIFHFTNRNPRPGEDRTYNLDVQPGGGTVGYVDVAVLPNLAGTGTVLMLNGFSMATNEAAANLVLARKLPSPLDRTLDHLSPNSKVEILLRVVDLEKSGLKWEIVSTRVSES